MWFLCIVRHHNLVYVDILPSFLMKTLVRNFLSYKSLYSPSFSSSKPEMMLITRCWYMTPENCNTALVVMFVGRLSGPSYTILDTTSDGWAITGMITILVLPDSVIVSNLTSLSSLGAPNIEQILCHRCVRGIRQ